MLDAIGATLPSAVAIAVSPLPIIAVILILMSPRRGRLGLAFLGGWLAGILVATTTFTLLAGSLPEEDAPSGQPFLGVVQICLGLALWFLGIRQWRSRPEPGTTPELPSWMSRIDDMGVPTSAGLAFALAAVNPNHLY